MARLRIVFLCCATLLFAARSVDGSSTPNERIKVHVEGFNWAATLITRGQFAADKKGAWNHDHPSRSQENDFIRDHGFSEYSKWHLAIDESRAPNSKGRYKFPFGDFRIVHRCGLLAVKARAHEYGYQEIENAAVRLLEMIESGRPDLQKRVTKIPK